jgi:hypothetical protein
MQYPANLGIRMMFYFAINIVIDIEINIVINILIADLNISKIY